MPMHKPSVLLLLSSTLLFLAACGAYADPVPNSATLAAEEAAAAQEAAVESGEVAALPTPTLVPPTATSLPPTATPLPPTATPLPPTPTEAAAELSQEFQDLQVFVQFGDPARGETLFNETYEVGMADGTIGEWACSTCHNVNSAENGVGPGMLGLAGRAGERVEGMPAEVYLYTSIVNPGDYVVEGFGDGVMPVGYSDLFTEAELYDIAAYLMTLSGE